MSPKYPISGNGLPAAKRTKDVIDYVSAGAAILTGGASDVLATPIKKAIEKRTDTLRQMLISDIENGRLTLQTAVQEDELASFVIRMGRAAVEGVAVQKLRIMARYFFNSANVGDFNEDDFLTSASTIEQLRLDELKALAIIKKAIADEKIADRIIVGVDDEKLNMRTISDQISRMDLFEEFGQFGVNLQSLARFGFIDVASGWGGMVYFATPYLFNFLSKIELDALVEG